MDEKKPDSEKKPEDNAESRLDNLEKNVDMIKESMMKMNKMLEKSLTKEEEGEAEKKKADEEEDKEKKKEEYEEKKPEDEMDKKKDVGSAEVPVKNEGEPNPGQGEVKLPQASAGETDETDKPAGEKVQVVAKDISKMVKKEVADIIKGMDLEKVTTPRPNHQAKDIIKDNTPKDLAMDFIKRGKEGTITPADMNSEIKEISKSDYDARLQRVLDVEA